MKTWFITGAAGFIGSNLSERLLESGDRVVGLDNFMTGKRENVDRLTGRFGDGFALIEGDIRDQGAVASAARGADVAVHLAAQVSVQRSMDDPQETDAINSGGFLSTVMGIHEAGVKRLIYASSCAVYGDNENLPLTETEPPAPMSPYAVAKLANELNAAALAPKFPDMKMVGLRFFNIFGPWQDAHNPYASVIPKWVAMCMEGRQPLIFGDGEATRDYCYVDNVTGLIQQIGGGGGGAQAQTQIYNVGTGVRTSLDDVYRLVTEALASRGIDLPFDGPRYEPWRPGEIVHSGANIERAQREAAYKADVDISKGLALLLDKQYGI